MSSRIPVTVRLADEAFDAIRRFNHVTVDRSGIPAPEVYEAIASLRRLSAGLGQALSQLGGGLERSLDDYDVYETDGADPLPRATSSAALLAEACRRSLEIGRLLDRAQRTLERQRYRDGAAGGADSLNAPWAEQS